MPLVLVHNDVVANPAHQWDDKEGEHYHYPSNYRGMIKTGEPFVYYRGVHREGFKRGPAQYIGYGRIGEIYPDPERPRAWYCKIEGYETFASPVAAKVGNQTREQIPRNMWRNGVRDLDPAVYAQIMTEGQAVPPGAFAAPPDTVTVIEVDDLIVPAKIIGPAPPGSGSNPGRRRLSKRAKAIGDWAERVAFDHIQALANGGSAHVHRAAQGETPGWDIDYLDADGVLQRVEVKGTIGAAFSGFDLTIGELRAAEAHGESYWICLVAKCETPAPRIQLIRDPFSRLTQGDWTSAPVLFAVKFAPPEQLNEADPE